MANKKIWMGILVMVLVFSMMVVGCNDGNGSSDPHKITITGLNGKSGNGAILLYSYFSENAEGVVAGWQGSISGNSITASLQGIGGSAWSGSGQYHIIIQIGNEMFAYTNGQTLEQLGIVTEDDFYSKMPKYNITGSETTITFNLFLDVTGI
ncbi:MAG: hypothetical protein FWG89_08460 [Treponema sp.]|nr:hypothetical protein [Treponema sp.]